MYGHPSYYPPFPFLTIYPPHPANFRFAYPTADPKMFTHSVKAFSPLMEQGRILLNRLSNPSFAYRIMEAAQHGNKTQVEALVKSIGLTVPITTYFSPTGIIFTLHLRENHHAPENCCSLSFAIKWGR